jgi:hypothetical protein
MVGGFGKVEPFGDTFLWQSCQRELWIWKIFVKIGKTNSDKTKGLWPRPGAP